MKICFMYIVETMPQTVINLKQHLFILSELILACSYELIHFKRIIYRLMPANSDLSIDAKIW